MKHAVCVAILAAMLVSCGKPTIEEMARERAQAEALLESGETAQGVRKLERLAAAGDPISAYRLGETTWNADEPDSVVTSMGWFLQAWEGGYEVEKPERIDAFLAFCEDLHLFDTYHPTGESLFLSNLLSYQVDPILERLATGGSDSARRAYALRLISPRPALGTRSRQVHREWVLDFANADDSEVQYRLASVLATGDGIFPRDTEQARIWLERAANNGHPFAASQWVDLMPDSQRDSARALDLLRVAAAEGVRGSRFELASRLLDQGEVVEGDHWIEQALADPAAQHYPTSMWLSHFRARDEPTAQRWARALYEKVTQETTGSSDRSSRVFPSDQIALAEMYALGLGGPRDPEGAMRLVREAAILGGPDSDARIAALILFDWNYSAEFEWAFLLLTAAANEESGLAALWLARVYERGNRATAQNMELARHYYRSAADAGYIFAMNWIANMYDEGRGTPQNFTEARRWYLAAVRGEAITQADTLFRLAQMYELGLGGRSDQLRAHMWFNLAAANGHERAASERDRIGALLSSQNLARAQRMAEQCDEKGFDEC
jgi:TPR repeat protein